MKCFTPDELIRFAMEPLCEEGHQIALHLLQCPECRENYQLALECLKDDDCEFSAAEEAEADETVSGLTAAAGMWEKFRNTIEDLGRQIAAPAGNIFSKPAFSFQRPAQEMFLAASSRDGSGASAFKSGDEVKFTFESYAAPESGSYWKMQMTMPRIPSASALITMKVTGSDGAGLEGTLNFLNADTVLSCGCANVPFKTFLENKGCREISFTARGGKVSPGRIKFLPESLR